MNLRSIQIHAVLLVVCLGALWWARQSEEEGSPKNDEGVVLVQAGEGETELLSYEDGERGYWE